MPAAPVTPAGVRDGDPAALIGLCAVRGPSVVAYCRQMVGDADAAEVAADAFGRFRAAVVATGDLEHLNPEPLLISATRNAAAQRAGRAAQGVCAAVPGLLAARADKEISLADAERLDEHLASCWACRAPVARFKAAERAYRDPPEPTIDHTTSAQIFVALSTAAPMRGAEPPAPPPAPSVNGTRRPGRSGGGLPLAATSAIEPVDALDQPTTEFRSPDVLDPDPVAARDAVAADPDPPGREGLVGSLLGSFGLGRSRADLRLPPRVDEPEPEEEIVLEGRPARERARERAGAGAGADSPTTIATGLPRTARRAAEPPPVVPRRRGDRPRRRRGLTVVLPIVLIVIALAVALFVAGVFGGGDPASSPRVSVPADVPSDVAPADVVVVPGAKPASGNAVEVEKARERARAQRKRDAAVARETTTPATTPPAPPAQPTAATPPLPPPPATANNGTTTKKSGTSRKIDAGSGATGAEQIPPTADTSNVPDLAPPPETATTP